MRSALSSIQQELHRLEEQGYLRHDLQNESHMKLVAHLAGQLAKFVEARLQMADLYLCGIWKYFCYDCCQFISV